MSEFASVKWEYDADKHKKTLSSVEFNWKIENFTSLPNVVDTFYDSPPFFYDSTHWRLRLFPNGESQNSTEGWIGIYLNKLKNLAIFNQDSLRADCVIGIQKINGIKEFQKGLSQMVFPTNYMPGFKHFLEKEKLVRRKSEFYPSGTLTLSIWLQYEAPFYSNTTRTIGNVSVGESCQQNFELKGVTLLSDDLKNLFLHQRDCDVSINVKGQIFKAHKLILKARSETIASILPGETAEKNVDVIEMDDCEPEAFEIVLRYLYSGKIEKLSDTNMFDVYYVAKNYDIADLKSECESYVKCSMTVKNICSIIQFARKHGVGDLLNCAVDYFTQKGQEIILTEEWKMFIKNEPEYGRELYEEVIKTLTTTRKSYACSYD